MQEVKVLLVQLASMGDCLFVTAIARQIKEIDFPNCHLTWLIGSRYTPAIKNNPYVDAVIEIPLSSIDDNEKQRNLISEHILNFGGYDNFNQIFVTDYTPLNMGNWFGTTRSALFRSYPYKLKVNPQPIIYLTDEEKVRVAEFCDNNSINGSSYNILFECGPQSGQSLMTLEKAKEIAELIVSKNSKIKFILSSNQPFVSSNPNIVDASIISWRENAELANYCNLLVGCSSGISWLCISQWTKDLPILQIINPNYSGGAFSASMKIDFKYFGIDTTNLIELYNPSEDILLECILAATENEFNKIKILYDVTDDSYFRNWRFLKESRILFSKKIELFIRWGLPFYYLKVHKNIKFALFTPYLFRFLKTKIFYRKS
jgi:hypothetical protein